MPRKRPARLANELFQKAKIRWCECQLMTTEADFVAAFVNFEFAERNKLWVLRFRCSFSPQEGFDTLQQNFGAEGLGDVIIRSYRKANYLIGLFRFSGEHDNRN